MTDDVIMEIFLCMIIYYIIPVFLMFASTFKVLTGLSLAIVLARYRLGEERGDDSLET